MLLLISTLSCLSPAEILIPNTLHFSCAVHGPEPELFIHGTHRLIAFGLNGVVKTSAMSDSLRGRKVLTGEFIRDCERKNKFPFTTEMYLRLRAVGRIVVLEMRNDREYVYFHD